MDVSRHIDVHIGEIRLVGVDDARPEALRAALGDELVRLLSADPAVRALDTGIRVEHHTGILPAGGSATALGRAAARAVVGRLQTLADAAGEGREPVT